MKFTKKLSVKIVLIIGLFNFFSTFVDSQRFTRPVFKPKVYEPLPRTYELPRRNEPFIKQPYPFQEGSLLPLPRDYNSYRRNRQFPNTFPESINPYGLSPDKKPSEQSRIQDEGYAACNKDCLAGLCDIAANAENFTGVPSATITEKKVYLTEVTLPELSVTAFYAQTNYKPATNHPNKFVIWRDISRISPFIETIVGEENTDTEQITYFVEEKLFLNDKFLKFLNPKTFGNKSSVFVIGKDSVLRRLFYLSQNGQIKRIVNYGGKIKNLFFSVENPNLFYLRQRNRKFIPLTKLSEYLFIHPEALADFNKYADSPIDNNNFRILNFFTDKAKEIVERNFPDNRVEFDLEEAKNRTEEQNLGFLENHFMLHPETTTFVVGHIDEITGNYLIEDSASSVIFRISIKKLEDIAAKYGVKIINLGCKSALQKSRGTINTVYSVDVANRLAVSVKAKTVKEFFTSLASEDLMLVIDRDFIEETRIRFEVTVLQDEKPPKKNKDNNNRESNGGGGNGNGGNYNGGSGNGGGNGNGGKRQDGSASKSERSKYVEPVGKMTITFPRINLLMASSSPTPSPTIKGEIVPPSKESDRTILYLTLGVGGIITAFVLVRGALRKDSPTSVNFSPTTSSADEMIEVACPFCKNKNRVIKKRAELAICGSCKKPLF